MIADLFARGAVAIAQFAPDVFPGLRDKRQHRLEAFLAFVLRVVALASAHLLAVDRVHRGVGVDGDDRQLHIGRGPHPFAHGPHDGQDLPGNIRPSSRRAEVPIARRGRVRLPDPRPSHYRYGWKSSRNMAPKMLADNLPRKSRLVFAPPQLLSGLWRAGRSGLRPAMQTAPSLCRLEPWPEARRPEARTSSPTLGPSIQYTVPALLVCPSPIFLNGSSVN